MDTVQQLRRRAQAAGNLQSSEQIHVAAAGPGHRHPARRAAVRLRPLLRPARGVRPVVVAGVPAGRTGRRGPATRARIIRRLGRLLVGAAGRPVVELLLRQLRLAPAPRARRASDRLLLPAAGDREPDRRGRRGRWQHDPQHAPRRLPQRRKCSQRQPVQTERPASRSATERRAASGSRSARSAAARSRSRPQPRQRAQSAPAAPSAARARNEQRQQPAGRSRTRRSSAAAGPAAPQRSRTPAAAAPGAAGRHACRESAAAAARRTPGARADEQRTAQERGQKGWQQLLNALPCALFRGPWRRLA